VAFDALFNQVLGSDGEGGKADKKKKRPTSADGDQETEQTLLGGLLDKLRSLSGDETRERIESGRSILGGGQRRRQ